MPPPYLSIFLNARTSVASYGEDVPVPKLALKMINATMKAN